MKRRRLGQSDLEVSVVAMGCWALAGDATWGPQDVATSIASVRAALDAGINFFDTAESYSSGRSEEILGEALKGRRHEAVIASKVSSHHLEPDKLKAACEGSLRRLGTDYLDVYYIHWPNSNVPIAETMGALDELQRDGKIRVAACSNFGKQDLSGLLETGRVEANQPAYNLLFRAIEYEIQGICSEHHIGITCYSPLAQGLLTGKFRTMDEVPAGRARTRHFASSRPGTRHGELGAEAEVIEALGRIKEICDEVQMGHASLAWLISRDAVASVIVGARTPEQAIENAKAGAVELPVDVLRQLTAATDILKEKLGPNADMWESKANSRIR